MQTPDKPVPDTANVKVALFGVIIWLVVAKVPEVGTVTFVAPVVVSTSALAPARANELPVAPRLVIGVELLSNPFFDTNLRETAVAMLIP